MRHRAADTPAPAPVAADEPALALRQRLHDATVAHMTEGVILCSARTTAIVYANPRYEAMLGYAPGELIGQPGGVVNSPAEADPQETVRRIQAELERQGAWQGVVRNRRKDGRDIWVRASISAFEHPEHGPVWLNVIGDITEEREAQLARDRATSELNRLASRMQQTIEAERAVLSRDVHDQVGSVLAGMQLRLSALAGRAGHDASLQAELREIAALAQAASVQTREICARLRPPALDDLGLVETCRWALDEWGRSTGLRVVRRLRRLPQEPAPALAIDVFRVLQELLTNVARHAAATRAEVRLGQRAQRLELLVIDDGRGFVPGATVKGLGLVGVRERAERHGGEVRIDSGPGGTSVRVGFRAGAVQ